jgi:hypothetical protein
MASPKIEVVVFYDSSGVPLTGLTPTFSTYKDDLGTNLSQPTITEIGGGAYKFTPVAVSGRGVIWVMDGGATAFPRRQAKFIRPEDYYGDDIATLLAVSTGKWEIKASGLDANRLILYDLDGTTVLQKFDLKDSLGNPTVVSPFSREPV